jgi:DNA ligase-1
MLFSHLVSVFERIEHQDGRTEMTRILSELLVAVDAQEARIISYVSLGLLYPVFESTSFSLAEKTLSPLLAQWADASADDWQRELSTSKDVATVFEKFWQHNKHNEVSSRSIVDVYDQLVAIEKVQGNTSKERKAQLLKKLLDESSATEAKFILRIILGVLRLGFSEMTFINALSWMLSGSKKYSQQIENAFNVCADIGYISHQLKSFGIDGLSTISVKPGVPIRPAAAERMTSPDEIFNKLGECVSQPKLDGFRLQVHKYTDAHGEIIVKFFSRNLQEKSDVFPELTNAVRALPIDSLIAEGEAICFDLNTGFFLPFQETAKRGRKHLNVDVVESHPLKFFVFDILWANGKSLLDLPNHERRTILESVIPIGGVVAPISQTMCNSGHDVDAAFLHAISEGLEGTVIKRNDTPYTPGKRNFNWIKLKRKETGELSDTIDCVIFGYYFGKGSRSALGIGAVLLGVYNPDTDQYESIARCGSGPTEVEWTELKQLCDEIIAVEKPDNVAVSREHAPDVWVYPTLVVVVRADEITISPLHKAGKTEKNLGFALRFPRIMANRDDKSAEDSTTVAEVARLYQLQKTK